MSQTLVSAIAADGRLAGLLAQAAQEAIEPMCGAAVTVVGDASPPWQEPPACLALVSLAESDGDGLRGLGWIGGDFEALAALAETLLGERPAEEDEMFQDCVQELANIFAGRIQEGLRSLGIATGLGLPLYVSGARRLHVGKKIGDGAGLLARVDLPDAPVLCVGFAAEEG
ncbi:MAG: chemotaxis protein CheX [Thermomicrobiaceae bacterium]|nr:chemotaxis protein CheX [Thermomicrobiaceae bacterium]